MMNGARKSFLDHGGPGFPIGDSAQLWAEARWARRIRVFVQ